MGLRGIKSHNLRTAHQILMKFGQKLQNIVGHHLLQKGYLEKPRSQDNPLNPLENNKIKKTQGFWA